jgi:hypothetical protein
VGAYTKLRFLIEVDIRFIFDCGQVWGDWTAVELFHVERYSMLGRFLRDANGLR